MEIFIGITVCAIAVVTLARVLYKREQRSEELLRAMEYAREKTNK